MPRPSAFNSTHFSSRKPHGEQIYREWGKSLGSGKNYTTDFNSLAMARVYAFAMALGRCKYALERAGSQFRPTRTLELLPALEAEYGLVPDPSSGINERRAELAVAAVIARGASRTNVESVFVALFSADFFSYFTVDVADAVTSTGAPESRGVYAKPGTPRTVWRTTAAIANTGIPVSIVCSLAAGDVVAPNEGSRLVIDPSDHGRVEAVTVTSASIVSGQLHLTATFAKPHVAGVAVASGRHPNVTTSKRHNTFVMDTAAVRANKTRRRLNRAAARLVRGVSTWSATDGSGPFRVGEGRLDITTIGVVA